MTAARAAAPSAFKRRASDTVYYDAGECLFEEKALPRAPSPKPFWRFFVGWCRCKPHATKKRRAHKNGERTFAKVLSPHPSFKNFKAFDCWRKAFDSQRKVLPPVTQNRTAASRYLSRKTVSSRYRRAKPRLPVPAFSSLHHRSPETSPCRGDHWSPAVSPTHRRAPQKLRSCRGDRWSPAFPADHTAAPRKPPLRRGDHWSPANTAPPVNGRQRFYPSFFRAASAAAVPAASPIAQQSAVTR